jgi:hypothetical protein
MNAFWKYHFFPLFVPAAILGARGLDIVVSRLAEPRLALRPLSAALLSLVLALPATAALVIRSDRQAQELYQALFSKERIGLEAYRRLVGKD